MDNKTRALRMLERLDAFHLEGDLSISQEKSEKANYIERALDEACGDAWDKGCVLALSTREDYEHLRIEAWLKRNPYKKNSGLGQAKGEVQEGALPSVSDPSQETRGVEARRPDGDKLQRLLIELPIVDPDWYFEVDERDDEGEGEFQLCNRNYDSSIVYLYWYEGRTLHGDAALWVMLQQIRERWETLWRYSDNWDEPDFEILNSFSADCLGEFSAVHVLQRYIAWRRCVTAEGVSCEKKVGPGLGDVRVCTSGENPHQTQIETLEDNAELAVQEGGQQS